MTQDKLSEELSAYELQVLIGTSISGCNMPPSTTFDLKAAWLRLYKLGLIDRVDGLAIVTDAGAERIRELLALRSATPMPGADTLETLSSELERVKGERDEARAGNHAANEYEPTWAELSSAWKARAERAEASLGVAVKALEEISSPAHTLKLLWWQIRAREALASIQAKGE